MKLSYETLTSGAKCGYLSIHIPSLCVGGNPPNHIEVDMPDEWFMFVNAGPVPVVGKQEGFLYLTRKGYEDNKDRLRTAFELAIASGFDRTDGRGWVAFEEYVENHFTKLAKAIEKKRKYLNKLLVDLDEYEKKM